MLQPNDCKGKLIIVEGIDGSGKSTQIALLYKWLRSQGKSVYFSEWNSSKLVKSTTKLGKKSHILTPTTFSLIHATDFADRLLYKANRAPPPVCERGRGDHSRRRDVVHERLRVE